MMGCFLLLCTSFVRPYNTSVRPTIRPSPVARITFSSSIKRTKKCFGDLRSDDGGDTSIPKKAPHEEAEPPRDEEGLLLRYDVVLCGTGLVQSLLASALARAGFSVLHCDGNDYYGEYDAVVPQSFAWEGAHDKEKEERVDCSPFSLRPNTSIHLHSTETLTHVPIQVGTELTTPYGNGEVVSLPQSQDHRSSVIVRLKYWTLANGKSPKLYVGIPPDASWEQHLLKLDLMPTRLRQAQQVLHQQRQFSLDLTPSLLYASGNAVKALLTSGVADYMEFKALEGLLWFENTRLSRVPCSKGDVFATSLLTPLDKRRLMKFLQLTLDYATAQLQREHAEDNNSTKNDNKTTSLTQVQALNEHHLNQGRSLARPQNKAIATNELQTLDDSLDMPFAEYLAQHAKLSSNLISIVLHALALEPTSNICTRQGMFQLCQHVQSLGRFGTTAFIVPMYGSGELSQSFCRSAAVHGATYLLRRAPKRVIVKDDKVQGILLSQEHAENEKVLPCDHVVVGTHAIAPLSKQRLYRRISIVLGRLLADQDEQRHVLIIPPGKMGNTCAIHGLVLDATVGVAPSGCTILHLTTTASEDENADKMLERVVNDLHQAGEVYHVSFSYALPDNEEEIPIIDGLHVCRPLGQSVTLDSQVEQAKSIFQSICPDVEFLTMSRKMDEIVKERLAGQEDDEDEERIVLESAMNMMEDTPDSGKQDVGGSEEDDA